MSFLSLHHLFICPVGIGSCGISLGIHFWNQPQRSSISSQLPSLLYGLVWCWSPHSLCVWQTGADRTDSHHHKVETLTATNSLVLNICRASPEICSYMNYLPVHKSSFAIMSTPNRDVEKSSECLHYKYRRQKGDIALLSVWHVCNFSSAHCVISWPRKYI